MTGVLRRQAAGLGLSRLLERQYGKVGTARARRQTPTSPAFPAPQRWKPGSRGSLNSSGIQIYVCQLEQEHLKRCLLIRQPAQAARPRTLSACGACNLCVY